jgi:two-component system, NtrC family, sensor histidine kinase HydH
MDSSDRAAPPPQDFRLMRWFALSGAAAIGAFSLAMALVLGEFLAARLLGRDAEVSREFVQSIVTSQSAIEAFTAHGASDNPAFMRFFTHLAAMPGVQRANVYLPDRSVLWSSDPALIGRRFADNDELDDALAGRVVVHRARAPAASPDKAEHASLGGRSDEYVENYLPVYDDGGDRLVGVIELYRRPTALFDAIRSGQRLVWASAAAGGLFLFATLIWFVRLADRALREQRARLVDAEALAIVGELSAAVAHSIRNPLGSIRSTAELQRELGTDPAAMDDIVRGVDRIDRLVSTLLSYAADPAEHPTRADLGEVLARAGARFGAELAAQGKAFDTVAAADLGTVAADPVLMTEVLNSLLANAAEATAPGDTVSLRAQRVGDCVQIEVSDSGQGIGDAGAERLFKPFYTTKPRGLGMGLALVRRVVTRLGGHVAFVPRAGPGSTVRIELPARPAAPTAAPP